MENGLGRGAACRALFDGPYERCKPNNATNATNAINAKNAYV